MHLRFITATPLNVRQGSGTFVGIRTLASALEALGHTVDLEVPRLSLPVYTAERLLFNAMLRPRQADVQVGFDMDGYRLAGRGDIPHVASIKGVIADELRFQRGLTWATMALQARCEAQHVRRADLVITTSQYAANRIQELYGARASIVPELIDLRSWQQVLANNPASPDASKFTVLFVGRLYRRKRLNVLLDAAALLRSSIPQLQIRIVGDGPEAGEFRQVWRQSRLGASAVWLGAVSLNRLAAEYNGCDVFCLPSVQEGFGIVFLEAMVAGKPIVAARAAAVPEVVRYGLLTEPDNPHALAEAIEALYRNPQLRVELAQKASEWVKRFDAPCVAQCFLEKVTSLLCC